MGLEPKKNGGNEVAVTNRPHKCCGWRGQNVDAQGFEAMRSQAEH